MRHPIPVVLVCAMLAGTGDVAGQTPSAAPTFAPNRPGFLDATSAAERGVWYIESGGDFVHAIGPGMHYGTAAGLVQVRVGLGGGIDVAIQDGLARLDENWTIRTGVLDPLVTISTNLPVPRGMEGRLILESSVPAGTDPFRAARWQPAARALLAMPMGGDRWLSLMGGVVQRAEAAGPVWRSIAGATYQQPVTARLGAFAELAGHRLSLGADAQLFGRLGATYLVTPRLQVDLDVAHGMTSADRGAVVGIGFSLQR